MKLCNGKYEFYTDEIGVLHCKRNGEEWPSQDENLLGNKAIHALYNYAKELEKKLTELEVDYLVGDMKQQAMAWIAVHRALKEVGLLSSVFSIDDNGLQRAVKYVHWMNEEISRLKNELDVVQGELDRLRAEGWTCDR